MSIVLLAAAAAVAAPPADVGVATPAAVIQPVAAPAAARPAILFNRWQEDWSPLADPAKRTDPLDRLKYIPLAIGDDAYLSLGGALRERFESNRAPAFGTAAANPGDAYVLSRLEAHADLRAGPVQAFVQLESVLAPGKAAKAPIDQDRLDLEQAFVAVVEPLGGGTLKLRAGRQQFAYDLQRFIAARDGPNVRLSFDALWGDYETGPWRFIAYYARPVANRDRRPFDDASSGGNLFYGARVERHVLGDNELSAYWSRYTNDAAVYSTIRGAERRDVWDMRFAGKRGAIDWDVEGMAQTGQIGAQRIRAWAFGSILGYRFAGRPLRPRIGIQVDGASGDRNPRDNMLGTFNPLFPNGYYLTLAGYTGYVNLLHVKPSLTLQPARALSVMAATGLQWRMTTADAIYTQPMVPVARTAGTGGRWTGVYGQLRGDWKMSAHWTGAVEAVHFRAGRTIRAAGGHDADYLGVELKYGW